MIETPRLVLRPWREADKPAFAAVVNTPAMMAHFGGVTTRDRLDPLIDAQIEGQGRRGYSMWAVDLKATGALAGICGVRVTEHAGTPVEGMFEIGWRIGEAHWGQGLAREAAEASIAWGWANTDHPRLGAWTSIGNTRSWGLMERLGMERRADLDFHHPRYPADDPDGAMIVYVLERP